MERSFLLEKIDRYLQEDINKLKHHLLEGDDTTLYLADIDMGGIPCSGIIEKLGNEFEWNGKKIGPLPVSYYHLDILNDYSKREPDTIVFMDYAPHKQELEHIREKSIERVVVLDHHPPHGDVSLYPRVCESTSVVFINPYLSLPETIKYWDGNRTGEYSRGVPVAYLLGRCTDSAGLDVSLQVFIALRGYGYLKLAGEWARERGLELDNKDVKRMDRAIESALVLSSYHPEKYGEISRTIGLAESAEDLKKITESMKTEKLWRKRNLEVTQAILDSERVDNVQVFPIETDACTIKPHVSLLWRAANNTGVDTIVCYTLSKNGESKASIRSKKVNLRKTLDKILEEMGVHNYGGHEKAMGFVCRANEMDNILKEVVESLRNKDEKR